MSFIQKEVDDKLAKLVEKLNQCDHKKTSKLLSKIEKLVNRQGRPADLRLLADNLVEVAGNAKEEVKELAVIRLLFRVLEVEQVRLRQEFDTPGIDSAVSSGMLELAQLELERQTTDVMPAPTKVLSDALLADRSKSLSILQGKQGVNLAAVASGSPSLVNVLIVLHEIDNSDFFTPKLKDRIYVLVAMKAESTQTLKRAMDSVRGFDEDHLISVMFQDSSFFSTLAKAEFDKLAVEKVTNPTAILKIAISNKNIAHRAAERLLASTECSSDHLIAAAIGASSESVALFLVGNIADQMILASIAIQSSNKVVYGAAASKVTSVEGLSRLRSSNRFRVNPHPGSNGPGSGLKPSLNIIPIKKNHQIG